MRKGRKVKMEEKLPRKWRKGTDGVGGLRKEES